MERKIYEIVYKTEKTYWWFVGQRYATEQFLRNYYGARKNLKILDVGCGTGLNVQMLGRYGKAYGIEISDDAIGFCRARHIKNIRKSDAMNIKFKSNYFDVVTSLGVFYHKNVKDDVIAMKEVFRVLKPKGRFFIFDCADMRLYGKHDIAFQGIRRYSKKELRAKLEKAGFEVEEISYVNTLLFPAIYLKRKLEKISDSEPESEIQATINPLLNFILKSIFKLEIICSKYIPYPFGINIYAVARKP